MRGCDSLGSFLVFSVGGFLGVVEDGWMEDHGGDCGE